MVIVAGVDEAGRGPAIGPLVVAAVSFQEAAADDLFSMGVRDSKALSPKRRELLAAEIKEISEGHSYFELQPWAIDKVVNRGLKLRKLNYLEAMAMAKAISDLHPDRVYVDTADVLPDRFGNDILRVLDWRPHLLSRGIRGVHPRQGEAGSPRLQPEGDPRGLRLGLSKRPQDCGLHRVMVPRKRFAPSIHEGLLENHQAIYLPGLGLEPRHDERVVLLEGIELQGLDDLETPLPELLDLGLVDPLRSLRRIDAPGLHSHDRPTPRL
jgi:hypothetical protein